MKERLRKIKEEFFNEESVKIFKHIHNNRNYRNIVHLVFNVTSFFTDENLKSVFSQPKDQSASLID